MGDSTGTINETSSYRKTFMPSARAVDLARSQPGKKELKVQVSIREVIRKCNQRPL